MLRRTRGRAAHGRSRRLGRRAGARLRVRGPDRRGMEAARGTGGPGRGARLAALRAGSRRASHRSHARRTTWRASPASDRRARRRARTEYLADGARAPRAPPLRRRPRAGRRSTGRSGSSKAPGGARRSSSSPRRSWSSSREGSRPRRSQSSVPRVDRVACVDRDGVRGARRPDRTRGAGEARGDARSARRCSRCCASPGQAAGRRELYAFLRSPYCGDRAPGCRLARGAAARTRGDSGPSARSRRRPSCATDGRCPCSSSWTGSASAPGRAVACRGDAAGRLRPGFAAAHERVAKRPARSRRRPGHPRRAGADDPGAFAGLSRDDVIASLERATVRGDGAAEPGRVAVLDLGRARTRRFEAVYRDRARTGLLASPGAQRRRSSTTSSRRALDQHGRAARATGCRGP